MDEPAANERKPVAFKDELARLIPQLRAFARGLCGRQDFADDLVQEAMLKAWAARDRYQPDTNMRAWVFTILRNCFLTEMRRNRFVGDYDEASVNRTLTANSNQESPLHLADLRRALMTLSRDRREALLLVGAGGFSYEEAAQICECAVGTVKSRVGRARAAMTLLLASDQMPERVASTDVSAYDALINEMAEAGSIRQQAKAK